MENSLLTTDFVRRATGRIPGFVFLLLALFFAATRTEAWSSSAESRGNGFAATHSPYDQTDFDRLGRLDARRASKH